jgi:hypothetical protein
LAKISKILATLVQFSQNFKESKKRATVVEFPQ